MRADARRPVVLDRHRAAFDAPAGAVAIDRVLVRVAGELVLAGTFLGISRHGRPVAPRARELFVPAGVVLLVIAWRSRRRAPVATIWLGLVALAIIGVGAHEPASGPWTLLAVTGTVAGCLACLRSAVRGPGDPMGPTPRSGPTPRCSASRSARRTARAAPPPTRSTSAARASRCRAPAPRAHGLTR